MANKNIRLNHKPASTLANTHSLRETDSPSKPSFADLALQKEFETTSPEELEVRGDVKFNMEKCSNSADLPSTQNHKAGVFGDV
jgi:hypothetical protein